MSPADKKQLLYSRVEKAKARDPRYFLRSAARPAAIARHAFHSSAVEGRTLSYERLYECARRQ